MDNHILLIDAGNSALKWMLSTESRRSDLFRNTYPEKLTETFFIECWKDVESPKQVYVSCVAGEHVWQMINQACRQLWSIYAERVSATQSSCGLINAYEKPFELGSDRWCAMIGAYHETNTEMLVVDCGSAMSIDIVNDAGKHLGGYIFPGLTMMKKSLEKNTADIDYYTKISESTLQPGKSTMECIDAAIYLSSVKIIEAVFEQQTTKMENVQCVLTGGDASSIAELLSIRHIIIPDLVIRGLSVVAKNINN